MMFGCRCIIASFTASPTKATRTIEDDADRIQEKLGLLLERIAVELRDNPGADTVRTWFDEAVELRNQVLGLAAAVATALALLAALREELTPPASRRTPPVLPET